MRSRIPGFYRLKPSGRLKALGDHGLDPDTLESYRSEGLPLDAADMMVENVVSTFRLPNAVAVNFRINGQDRLIPMVVEEPSVVAAVSNIARITRSAGGFIADADPSVMIGQVQCAAVQHPKECMKRLERAIPRLHRVASAVHPRLQAHGGGIRGFKIRHVVFDEPGSEKEHMVVLHFHLDCADAMGANMVNTVAEALAPHVAECTGEKIGLKILSNLADKRLARASIALKPQDIQTHDDVDPVALAEGIASAWRFAWADPYRAATHNKGVMNGVDAVALATGNDWRAIEAGAHAWAARDGQYRPLTRWSFTDGMLIGSIELPTQFGVVGGPIRVHPTVQSNLKLMGIQTAQELSGIAAAVGLAQNLGALRALAVEGIQAGHMRMHARTVAATAGATPEEIGFVTAVLVEERDFSVDRATTALLELRRV